MAHSRKVQLCRCGHALGFHYFRTVGGKRKAACNHGTCPCKAYSRAKPEDRGAEPARFETTGWVAALVFDEKPGQSEPAAEPGSLKQRRTTFTQRDSMLWIANGQQLVVAPEVPRSS